MMQRVSVEIEVDHVCVLYVVLCLVCGPIICYLLLIAQTSLRSGRQHKQCLLFV